MRRLEASKEQGWKSFSHRLAKVFIYWDVTRDYVCFISMFLKLWVLLTRGFKNISQPLWNGIPVSQTSLGNMISLPLLCAMICLKKPAPGFSTLTDRGCLSCFISVEQCCRYESQHIHSLDKFIPLRLEWHCCNVLFPFLFYSVILFQQEHTSETFIVASICWAGNEDEMGFCVHKCSAMLIRGDVNRIQTITAALCIQLAW